VLIGLVGHMTALGFEPKPLALVAFRPALGQTVDVRDPRNAFPSPLVHGAAAALTGTSPARQPQACASHLSQSLTRNQELIQLQACAPHLSSALALTLDFTSTGMLTAELISSSPLSSAG